jgi:hypothetical protein
MASIAVVALTPPLYPVLKGAQLSVQKDRMP